MGVYGTLTNYIKFWKICVDDPIYFVKTGSVEYLVSVLNSFGANIQFISEIAKQCRLPFLDVFFTRNVNNIVATVYHKTTANDLHLNWNLHQLVGKGEKLEKFAPTSWKRGTLKTLIDRPYLICFSRELRKQENEHLKQVFHEKK